MSARSKKGRETRSFHRRELLETLLDEGRVLDAGELRVEAVEGDEFVVVAALDDLAHLRIRVFADWPYLYDGDAAYEADYLKEFAAAPDAVLVAAFAGARIVGAATAAPMVRQLTRALQSSVIMAYGISAAGKTHTVEARTDVVLEISP